MSTEVQVALIAAAGGVVVALVGVLVELIRSRRGNARDHKAVLTEVSSIQKVQDEIKEKLTEVQAEQNRHGARLATIEARFDDHLLERRRTERRH